MALICKIEAARLPKKFGEFGQLVINMLTSLARAYGACRVDFVGDRYHDRSIKDVERGERAADGTMEMLINSQEQALPKQWQKFLSSGANKEQLLCFIAKQFCESTLQDGLTYYVTHKELCFRFSRGDESQSGSVIQHLTSDHEEADTRIMLHVLDAKEHNNIIIHSPDTDVAVIAINLAYHHKLENLKLALGTQQKRRIIDISQITEHHGQLSPALAGLHAFSGCDTIPSFSGKGKRTVINKLGGSAKALKFFTELGTSFDVTAAQLSAAEEVVCQLYGLDMVKVDEARYVMFCSSGSESSMPPTKDALTYNLQRANYQTAIWKKADTPFIDVPPPEVHGWLSDESGLSFHWMSKPVAPPEILQLSVCQCKRGCSGRCSCHSANLACTDLCKCGDECENRAEVPPIDEDSDDSDDDL